MLDIHIKNYQSLKDVKLSFKKGINIITGKTNSGKSAIYRAIMSAVFNIPNESHVRLGTTKASVILSNENGVIEWERDLSKASQVSYTIDGVKYAKTGGKALDEVIDKLGLGKLDIDGIPVNLNFHLQMAYPFLLSNSPAQLYKVFTQTGNKYDFLEILSKIKSDTQNIKDTHSSEEKFRDKLQLDFLNKKEILDSIVPNISVVDDILALESSVNKLDKLSTFINASVDLENKRSIYSELLSDISKLSTLQETYSQFIKYDDFLLLANKVDKYRTVYSDLLSDISKLSTLQKLYSQYIKYDDFLLLVDKVDKYHKVITLISDSIKVLSDLYLAIQQYIYVLLYIGITQLESLRSCYIQLELLDMYDKKFVLEKSISDLNTELDEIGICPTCNQPLNGLKIDI